MRPISFRRWIAAAVSVLGIVLLGLSLAEHVRGPTEPAGQPPREWEAFDPDLARRARTLSNLRASALSSLEGRPEATGLDTIRALHRTVSRRFTHGWASHTPTTNWILWSLGLVHPGFRHIYAPEILVSARRSVLCDQAAVVLAELARSIGLEARIVWLTGHVATELWAEGQWRYLDADLEVTGRLPSSGFLSLAELSERPEAVASLYRGPRSGAIPVLLRRQKHYATPSPERLAWQSSLLVLNERAMEILEYVIPLVLVLAGGSLLLLSSERSAPRDPSDQGRSASSFPRAMARKSGLDSRSSS